MRRTNRGRRAPATLALMAGIGTIVAPSAWADPTADAPTPPPPPAAVEPVTPTPAAVAACSTFAEALNIAALNYTDFANALAIGEVNPDYADPSVSSSNVLGRTALRQAAATALSAAGTPGLQRDVAAPMRSWAMGATKLLFLMGMRASVDRINNAATQLNDDTSAAQMACARAGTHA